MTRETYAHLVGYSTLALILGTATWSTYGWVLALPLVLGTLALVGLAGARLVIETARIEDEPLDLEGEPEQTPATDGGRSPSELAATIRRDGSGTVSDADLVRALEDRDETTGGGRNRRHSSSEHN